MNNEVSHNRCIKVDRSEIVKHTNKNSSGGGNKNVKKLKNKYFKTKEMVVKINLNKIADSKEEGDNIAKNKEIGKTIASDKYSNTIDGF